PGPVIGLQARTRGKTKIELDFNAPGTDAQHPPPARSYLVKQSLRPIRNASDFAHAQRLCKGACGFSLALVGQRISLMVTGLRPHTTYYYAVAARDNVSARLGPRSPTIKAKTA
ncbi:MAG: fibronectin type III domain-containing protein, partial [Actinomycetota bacterium]|nr:fibronectin type III domain-containing protein [Actinomycetota bacterium]